MGNNPKCLLQLWLCRIVGGEHDRHLPSPLHPTTLWAAVTEKAGLRIDIHSCELIFVSVACDPHCSLWLWKMPTKFNRPLQLRARWKTTGKAVCCAIHSCTWAYGKRRMRGGSRRRELCITDYLSNHAIHCKSVFLQSYKIMLQLLIKIPFSIIMHANMSTNTSGKCVLTYLLIGIFPSVKGY